MRRWFSLWTTLGLCIFGLLGFVYLQDAYAQTPIAVTPIPVDPPLATLAPHSPMPPIGVAYIQSHRVSVTVQDQVAVTTIEQVFVNEGSRPAEGTYLFPLPAGAAVSNLTMIVDGTPIKAQILDAKQAEQIYTQTVRQMRDPALLQYIGQSAIQANVFPIPAGDKRTLQITYSQALTADNGLINYVY